MLVNRLNFAEAVAQLARECVAERFVGFDTETTALFWWQSPHYAIKPRVFSMQFATAASDYYFDFGCEESIRDWEQNKGPKPLDAEHFAILQALVFSIPDIVWFVQNFKFDAHHCYNHGCFVAGTWHCTQAIARVMNNLEPDKGMSLDALSEKYFGEGKIDLSEYWKPEDGRVSKVKKPGENGKFYDFLHFDKLPLEVLVKYGIRDTRLVYRLGLFQLEQIIAMNEKYFGAAPSTFGGSLLRVLDNERELTKTLFWAERRGVQLDMPFVKLAHADAVAGIKNVLAEIDPIAKPYVDKFNADAIATAAEKDTKPALLANMEWNSSPHLKGLFTMLGIPYQYTEKGTASFDKDCLEKSKHPLAAKILEYRRHSKRAHTYLENFLWLADTDGVLHCNFAQGGAQTGRMSCREPNLQNVPKRADKKEADFVLRKCFVPRKGKILVSCDYDQVEYRLMLDYAREMVLINQIVNDGLDVHDATEAALKLGDRDTAKTMNFMLLYGGGVAKLADALYDIPVPLETLQAVARLKLYNMSRHKDYLKDRALWTALSPELQAECVAVLRKAEKDLRHYFKKLPEVEKFVKNVKKKAKDQGAIFTWLGRVLQYGMNEWGSHDSYKAPNGLIQGGAGDLSKVAVNRCGKFLQDYPESFLILHVHDELVFEIDEKDAAIVGSIVEIMKDAYPHRLIPLTAGAAFSKKSWGDLQDGVP